MELPTGSMSMYFLLKVRGIFQLDRSLPEGSLFMFIFWVGTQRILTETQDPTNDTPGATAGVFDTDISSKYS